MTTNSATRTVRSKNSLLTCVRRMAAGAALRDNDGCELTAKQLSCRAAGATDTRARANPGKSTKRCRRHRTLQSTADVQPLGVKNWLRYPAGGHGYPLP